MTATDQASLADKAGKYLTFLLGEETFGLEIMKVQEIIGMMPVTRVPRVPGFVRGVVNLRGKVIPVIDLRLKFGFPAKEDTERTCIIVAQIMREGHSVIMGVIVDEVSEVLDISSEQMAASPDFGSAVHTDFILGMGKIDSAVVMLLDVDRVLSSGEIEAVDEAGLRAEQETPQESVS